jgi:itaconyl-CoA hydratase
LDLVSAEVISFDGKTVDEALAREAGRTLASARARGLSRQLIPHPPCDEGDNIMEAILPAYKAIGERRYRETSGLYFEDFEPRDVFEHLPARTVLDADNTYFTLLTLNIQPVHFDAAYAAKTEWKKMPLDSTFILALLTGVSVRTVSAKFAANLGWDKVKASHPMFAGDTFYAESSVLHKRHSKSRPTLGIITVLTRGINQEGAEVMSFERTMLVHRRGHSPKKQPTTDRYPTDRDKSRLREPLPPQGPPST